MEIEQQKSVKGKRTVTVWFSGNKVKEMFEEGGTGARSSKSNKYFEEGKF